MTAPGWQRTARLSAGAGEVNTFGFQRHLVGDFEDGRIYDMRLDHYFDDERALVRVRRMPSVEAQQRRLRHSLFRLRCDAGVGLDGGAIPGMDPQMRLRWSDDDGSSWSIEIWRSAGRIGATGQVVEWRMLGQSTAARAMNSRCSDPVPVSWTDAWVEVADSWRHIDATTDPERHCASPLSGLTPACGRGGSPRL